MSQARTYHSPRRELGAAATRRDLIAAARRLFARNGYAQVTVADIAREAGTAVKTVYASVGGKAEILREILEGALQDSGAEETIAQVRAASDAATCLALLAHGTRLGNESQGETLAILNSAMHVHQGAEALWERIATAYRAALRRAAEHLDDLGCLPAGMTADRYTDLLWFCFGPQAWRVLVGDCHWTWDEAETRLAATATTLLVTA